MNYKLTKGLHVHHIAWQSAQYPVMYSTYNIDMIAPTSIDQQYVLWYSKEVPVRVNSQAGVELRAESADTPLGSTAKVLDL